MLSPTSSDKFPTSNSASIWLMQRALTPSVFLLALSALVQSHLTTQSSAMPPTALNLVVSRVKMSLFLPQFTNLLTNTEDASKMIHSDWYLIFLLTFQLWKPARNLPITKTGKPSHSRTTANALLARNLPITVLDLRQIRLIALPSVASRQTKSTHLHENDKLILKSNFDNVFLLFNIL